MKRVQEGESYGAAVQGKKWSELTTNEFLRHNTNENTMFYSRFTNLLSRYGNLL